jgi:hypothetical protein
MMMVMVPAGGRGRCRLDVAGVVATGRPVAIAGVVGVEGVAEESTEEKPAPGADDGPEARVARRVADDRTGARADCAPGDGPPAGVGGAADRAGDREEEA